MGLVEDEDGFRGIRQHDAAADAQIGQHQVVVGDHDVGVGDIGTGAEHRALVVVPAASAVTPGPVVGDGRPSLRGHTVRPIVEVAVPGSGVERLLEPSVDIQVFGLRGAEQAVALRIVGKPIVEALQADVPTTPLGNREAEVEVRMGLEVGQVPQRHLFL